MTKKLKQPTSRPNKVNPGAKNDKIPEPNTPTNSVNDSVDAKGNARFPSTSSFDFKPSGVLKEGAQWIENDVEKMKRWMLLSGSSFLTWPHYDAGGLGTWTQLLNGLKIWIFLVAKNRAKDVETGSKQMLELTMAMSHLTVETENLLPNLADPHVFFLFPGTLL